MFLQAYSETGSVDDARALLVNGRLPQRSRVTRSLIVRIIHNRLMKWNPPVWVLDDLAAASQQTDATAFRALLLVHYARQETLVYDAVQHIIGVGWERGDLHIRRDDVQRFLDTMLPTHPEIAGWSYETRVKLAGNLLTTLRDYGLLIGNAVKRVVEPTIDERAVGHLWRLLEEEGVPEQRIAAHPDWRIWLLSPARVEQLKPKHVPSESMHS
ncbi:MAG: DUF1819 family protein [Chloroflexota bacterium]|nr:DUF1819 family protein [Chloroflexota bacterium]